MTKRTFLIAERLIFGVLTLSSLAILLGILIHHQQSVVNFFSYFTNLSNIFASVVLLVGAVMMLQNRQPTKTQEIIRGASVVAMVIVGIVYFALLRNEELGLLPGWINYIVHLVMPLVVLFDWLFQPPSHEMNGREMALWLIYPLLFLVYSLVRGPLAGWYPYPFLNPAKAGGYGGVALYSLGIFVAFLVIGSALATLANRLPRNVA